MEDTNPAKKASKAALKAAYHDLAGGLSTDLSAARALLTDDFNSTSKSQGSLDKSAYLAFFAKLSDKNLRVHSMINQTLPRGADEVAVFVTRRVTTESEGKRINEKSNLEEIWVRSGDSWKLKSSTEQ